MYLRIPLLFLAIVFIERQLYPACTYEFIVMRLLKVILVVFTHVGKVPDTQVELHQRRSTELKCLKQLLVVTNRNMCNKSKVRNIKDVTV